MNEELKAYYDEHLSYIDGKLFWKKVPKNANRLSVGDEAGFLCEDSGYRFIKMLGKKLRAHRVIWFCEKGEIPDNIDHINGIRDDNRLCNLRNVSKVENNRNRKINSNNKLGCFGVYYKGGDKNRFIASIGVNNRTKHIGTYKTLKEAVKARKDAEIKYGYHENHGRKG